MLSRYSRGRILVALFGAAWLLTTLPQLATADDAAPIVRELLERDLLPSDLPLQEVQEYTEARVPRLITPTDRDDWRREAERLRQETLDKIVYRGEAARWRDAETRVEWLETIPGGEGYRIKKLRYEALPGLWIPALLYEPENLSARTAVALNVNGHDGQGKAAGYKQIRCINQAKRGMLALNVEWLGMGQLRGDGYRHYCMNQLDLCGTSGLAPFYLAMKRGLDVLLAHPHADPERVAVAGLSGGGWQTIVISALDPRVTLSNPVAGYSSFRTRARRLSDLGDSEQTPTDLATVVDYTHLTALRAPRPTLLTFNAKDNCCFASGHALPPLVEAAGPVFTLFGKADHLRSHVNHDPGTHNFERENREALYQMIGDFFYADDQSYLASEIECAAEVKTSEELAVELPTDNADFNKLALDRMKSLPARVAPPADKDAWDAWRKERVAELEQIVRAKRYEVAAQETGGETRGDVKAVFWRLRIGDVWTVPAVELIPAEPKGATILLADGGRAEAASQAAELLARGQRVVAVDPFYHGESKITQRDFLYALLVAAVGDRPLGLQSNQIAAVARWLHDERKAGEVTIAAVGRRMTLAALVAAATEDRAIRGLTLHHSLGSLKQVIEENAAVNEAPELFCFGLLEKFDVCDLAQLATPRPVSLPDASERVRAELHDLSDAYTRHGAAFDPFAAP